MSLLDMVGTVKDKVAVKGAGQEQITQSYALRILLQGHLIMFDIMEQTSFDLDKVHYPQLA